MFAMEYIFDMIRTPINGGLVKICYMNQCICIGLYWTYSVNNWDKCLLEVSVHPMRVGKCAFSRIYIL